MPEPSAVIPPHAPDTTGRLRKILGAFHVTGVFWYRFHCWGLSILPESGIWAINYVFTFFFFFLLRRIRRAIASNLVPVLGPCNWWERQIRIWRTMLTFAWCLTERYESMISDKRSVVSAEGEGIWQDLTSTSKGLIIVTAHIGHWEIGSRLPLSRGIKRIHVVREPEVDPEARKFVQELIEKSSGGGYEVHFADDTDPTFGARLLTALRHGDAIALQGDRPRARGQSKTVSMFDLPFDLPVGPVALARAANVPIVPVFVFREGRLRSRVVVRAPIKVSRTTDRHADMHSALQQIADEVQWAISERPTQWFCFRELWPGNKNIQDDRSNSKPGNRNPKSTPGNDFA